MASFQGKRLSQVVTTTGDVAFADGDYATMEQGAVVRQGVEKTSAKVGDLVQALVVVERREASCGTERLRITSPIRGWVSAKIVSRTPLAAADDGAHPETKEPEPPAALNDANVAALERQLAQQPGVEYQFLKGLDYSPGGTSTTGFFVAPSDDDFMGSDAGGLETPRTMPDSGDEAEPALPRISSGNIERPPVALPRVSSGNIEAPASAFPRIGSGNLEVPVSDQDYKEPVTPIKQPTPPPQRTDPTKRSLYALIKCCYSSGAPAAGVPFASP